METINLKRLFLAGLIAGVVLNLLEYAVNGIFLKDEWEAALAALGFEPFSGSGITMIVLLTLILGFLAVWLYAAIRPRFGPGPRTALYASLLIWALMWIYPTVYNSLTPIFPSSLMMTSAVFALFEMPIATVVGAWFYKEDSETAAAREATAGDATDFATAEPPDSE